MDSSMREGVLVQWVTSCLLPFPYLVSLGQAACSLVLGAGAFSLVMRFRPHIPFFLSSGRLMLLYVTPCPVHSVSVARLQEQSRSVVSPALGTWEVLRSCCVHVGQSCQREPLLLVGSGFLAVALSPLLQGRPRTGGAGTGACFQWLPDAVPTAWLFSVSVIFVKIFSA